MKQDVLSPKIQKKESATMEEMHLVHALDAARDAFAREAREATNITLRRKYVVIPTGIKVGAAFRKNLRPLGKSDRKYLDEYIDKNPDTNVAKAKKTYEAAYAAWKGYLYAHKNRDAADEEVRSEVTKLILKRRQSALQGGLENFVHEHPFWSVVIAGVTLAALGPLLVQVVTIPAALAALGVGIGGRFIVSPPLLRMIRHIHSSNPEVAGRAMANWEYGSNWFWFISAMMTGLYVRIAGAENVLVSLTGMSHEQANHIVHTKLASLVGPAEAAAADSPISGEPTGQEIAAYRQFITRLITWYDTHAPNVIQKAEYLTSHYKEQLDYLAQKYRGNPQGYLDAVTEYGKKITNLQEKVAQLRGERQFLQDMLNANPRTQNTRLIEESLYRVTGGVQNLAADIGRDVPSRYVESSLHLDTDPKSQTLEYNGGAREENLAYPVPTEQPGLQEILVGYEASDIRTVPESQEAIANAAYAAAAKVQQLLDQIEAWKIRPGTAPKTLVGSGLTNLEADAIRVRNAIIDIVEINRRVLEDPTSPLLDPTQYKKLQAFTHQVIDTINAQADSVLPRPRNAPIA